MFGEKLNDFLLVVALFVLILLGAGYIFITDLKYSYLCKQAGYEGGFVDMYNEPYCIHRTGKGHERSVSYYGILKEQGKDF